jgi:hypothetical protein
LRLSANVASCRGPPNKTARSFGRAADLGAFGATPHIIRP